MLDKGVLRIIDVNFNRCKEGLRVIEDFFRFATGQDAMRKRIRKQRHSLDGLCNSKTLKKALLHRNSEQDPGRKADHLEFKRKDVFDILYVNFQRVKESLRVLEECFKLTEPEYVPPIKKIRYDIYTLEKKAFAKRPSVRLNR